MSMKLKGFTLIELLVVIAIIGVLATVVVGAVNSARVKGADATVKSNLQALRVESELWYDSNSSYGTDLTGSCPTAFVASSAPNFLAGSQPAQNAMLAAARAGGSSASTAAALTCRIGSTGTAWAVSAPLKTTGQHWCIDSSGNSKQTTAAVAATSC
jgi:prepilin-type N-terminal cleavage/methylation domain-containing protein